MELGIGLSKDRDSVKAGKEATNQALASIAISCEADESNSKA